MALTIAERVAQVCEHLIEHDAHGYSQPDRAGDGTTERVALSDGSAVTVHGGDYDCSELVRVCVNCALTGSCAAPIDWMYTGNERAVLKDLGFVQVNLTQARRGDVLWRSGHTEVHLGGGMCGGARIDESGTIYGAARGDQRGNEIARGAYSVASWSSCWRYCGAEPQGGTSTSLEPALAVDGWLGAKSVSAWQAALGTVADGVVSGQSQALRSFYPNLLAVEFGAGGSSMVVALQKRLGAAQDGVIGPATVRALQRRLGVTADGVLGTNTAKAVQRSLNEGQW